MSQSIQCHGLAMFDKEYTNKQHNNNFAPCTLNNVLYPLLRLLSCCRRGARYCKCHTARDHFPAACCITAILTNIINAVNRIQNWLFKIRKNGVTQSFLWSSIQGAKISNTIKVLLTPVKPMFRLDENNWLIRISSFCNWVNGDNTCGVSVATTRPTGQIERLCILKVQSKKLNCPPPKKKRKKRETKYIEKMLINFSILCHFGGGTIKKGTLYVWQRS